MWIRGDWQVIDTTGKILVSSSVISLAYLVYCIYFEQFTLLVLELYLVILGCKPKLEVVVVRHRALLFYYNNNNNIAFFPKQVGVGALLFY